VSESKELLDHPSAERLVVHLDSDKAGDDSPRVLSNEEIAALRETKRTVSEYAARLLADRKRASK
jgi:hypothetical protein